MSAAGLDLDTDEAAIRRLLEEWASAVRRHDLEAVLAHHAADIVTFDVPDRSRGIRAYAESWPPFFRYLGKRGQFDLDELAITAASGVAFATAILLVRGEADPVASPIRLTVGLRKVGGAWTVAHEHHSAAYPVEEPARGSSGPSKGEPA